MNDILALLKPYRTISIIGMEKNVGKTTVLNHIINKTRGKIPLGLTSIGRDGEETDIVTNTEKPKIYIEKETIYSTAKELFLKGDVTKEVLRTTGINTPMGEVIIGRALSDGYVEIGGPSINSEIKKISDEMLKLGAEKVLIDGALSRKTMASPTITEATILSTGAALSRSIDKVVEKSALTVRLLSTEKELNNNIISVANNLISNNRLGLIYKDLSYSILNVKTALESSKFIIENLIDEVEFIVLKGVFTDKLAEDLIKSTDKIKGKTILVEDGTKLFLSSEKLDLLFKFGVRIKVLERINIVCLTINPKSPYGYEFERERFKFKLQQCVNLPVFDVLGDE
ncbi:hypothetical protein ABG79_00066 [Caloramator mitchellensis]|uniref:Uncharacterized protein n=1 Tax=Caloramator mitchellensis TaxID=908809 RepID=A0A0R3K047_CALMK|nr:hypothetical protein [Caloramator mitchellensis]KRQ87901.1 hypothetical protein ABG79_00066 [Caloramator mitchellensis]